MQAKQALSNRCGNRVLAQAENTGLGVDVLGGITTTVERGQGDVLLVVRSIAVALHLGLMLVVLVHVLGSLSCFGYVTDDNTTKTRKDAVIRSMKLHTDFQLARIIASFSTGAKQEPCRSTLSSHEYRLLHNDPAGAGWQLADLARIGGVLVAAKQRALRVT